MSESLDVKIVTAYPGAVSNTKVPLFRVPAYGGGVTVLDCAVVVRAAGTSTFNLVILGTGSTATAAASGTIASPTGGTGLVLADKTVTPFTVSTPYVAAGSWVGFEETNVGSITPAISLSFTMGK